MTASDAKDRGLDWYVEIVTVRDGLEVVEHTVGPFEAEANAEKYRTGRVPDRAGFHARTVARTGAGRKVRP